MARLSHMPAVFKSVGVLQFFKRVYDEIGKDNLWVWASALAYSWLFAIFPFFIFLLALIPHLPERAQKLARTEIKQMVAERLPSAANSMLWKDIEENRSNLLNEKSVNRPMLYLGLLVALWAASGGTAMTMSALDRCYELDTGRNFFHHRLVALLLTIVVAAMLLAVVCLLPIASLVKHWIIREGLAPGKAAIVLFDIGRWTVSVLLMVLVLTVVYYNGPAIRHAFCFLTPGALFVVVVWVVLGLLFRLYVDRIGAQGYNKTYGTVGGVAILLLFFYIDALVLLVGAEINAEVDFEILRVRRGSRDFRKPEDFTNGAPTSI